VAAELLTVLAGTKAGRDAVKDPAADA